MTTLIIIYLIGYIVAYYGTKLTILKTEDPPYKWNWEYVRLAGKWALLSWAIVIVISIAYISIKIEDNKIKWPKLPKDPPKWL